jgi:hypothetical protein
MQQFVKGWEVSSEPCHAADWGKLAEPRVHSPGTDFRRAADNSTLVT